MRIETEIEALTVGSLRALLAQAERAGASNHAAVSFSRRRTEGGHVARVEFEPVVPQRVVYLQGDAFEVPADATISGDG